MSEIDARLSRLTDLGRSLADCNGLIFCRKCNVPIVALDSVVNGDQGLHVDCDKAMFLRKGLMVNGAPVYVGMP